MNYREAWANGEIEVGTLVDAIESLAAEHPNTRQRSNG